MTKEENYKLVFKQIKSLIETEENETANLANVANFLGETFNWWWTGFYKVIDDQLVLGPFRGPVACTRIDFGKGVCGTSWKEERTIVVKNVHDFPGHIACSSESLSEIVVPIIKKGKVKMVLDVDSEKEGHFDEIDQKHLEIICNYLASRI